MLPIVGERQTSGERRPPGVGENRAIFAQNANAAMALFLLIEREQQGTDTSPPQWMAQADNGGKFALKEIGLCGGRRCFGLHRFCQFLRLPPQTLSKYYAELRQ